MHKIVKAAVMQPYFFPYIGYWQLIKAVDKFVLFDDVNYINRGWINRNRIILNGDIHYINLPMCQASQNKKINEISLDKSKISKSLNKIQEAYKKAPFYSEVIKTVSVAMNNSNTENIAVYLGEIIRYVCEYLQIDTDILVSSALRKNNSLKGEEKIIEICKTIDANWYINASGGRNLYHCERFKAEDIKLSFIKMGSIKYEQYGKEFHPDLSIIDVLMFCGRDQVIQMLTDYELIDG